MTDEDTFGVGFIEDPDRERILLNAIEARRRQYVALQSSVTPDVAQRGAALARLYPSLGGDAVSAMSLIPNLDPHHPAITQLAQRKAIDDQSGFDRLKAFARGTVRTAFTAANTLFEEGVSRPFRTAIGVTQGKNPVEAYQDAGVSAGAQALTDLAKGRDVNLGSGYFPNSDLAVDTPEYTALTNAGVDADQAAGAIQAQLGRPVTQLARDQAEQGTRMFGQPVSPGRFVAGAANELIPGEIIEPGTTQYNLLSGLFDAAAQIKLDPTNIIGGRIARLRAANQEIGERTIPALLTGRPRKTIFSQGAEDWLNSADGQQLIDWIAKTDNLIEIRSVTKARSRELLTGLTDATDPGDVHQLLRESLGIHVPRKPVPAPSLVRQTLQPDASGTVGRFLGGRLAGEVGEIGGFKTAVSHKLEDGFLGRMLGQMPGHAIDVDDLDTGLGQFDEFLQFANFTSAEREPLLQALARVDNGDVAAAWTVMSDAMTQLNAKLISEGGASQKIADEVTDVFKSRDEFRKYAVNEFGKAEPFAGSQSFMRMGGEMVTVPTAQLLTEYLQRAIPLPNARQFRELTGTLAKARLAGADKMLSVDSAQYLADAYMQKFWKPAVLLRLAWPLRVIAEEQVRMSAEGLSSTFRHPISYLSWVIGNSDSTKAGQLDSVLGGFLEGIGSPVHKGGLIDDISMSRMHGKAMSQRGGGWLGEIEPWQRNQLSGDWVMVRRGEGRYLDAWMRNIVQLADDPVASKVAELGVDDAKEWFWNGFGDKFRRDLVKRGGPEKAPLLTERLFADAYIEAVNARVHLMAGGRYSRYSRSTGEKLVGDDAIWGAGIRDASFNIDEIGESVLIRAIAEGTFHGSNIRRIEGRAQLTKLKNGLARHTKRGPDEVKGVRLDNSTTRLDGMDTHVNRLFGALMSTPTNNLSRSPAFRQFYWRRVNQMMGSMDDATRTAVEDLRKAAKISDKEFARLGQGVGIDAGSGVLDDLEMVDDLAKGFALDETRKLLYDLEKKSNAADILRNIFPFGEAWAEIITTWSRLLAKNPHEVRRFQQTVQGARSSGFFYENDNGEEMYAVPFGGLVKDWMFGKDSPVELQLAGRVRSLNMITATILPGYGPIVQIAATHGIPETPKYEELRGHFIPFGPTKIENPGDLVEIAAPSWLTNILVAADSNDPDMNRIYNGTVMLAYRALIMSGEGSDTDPGQASETLEEAKRIARTLGFLRAAATFGTPSPLAIEYNVRDKNGELWGFTGLAREYQDYLNTSEAEGGSGGDEIKTFQWFTDTFGLDASLFATRQTRTLVARAVTEDASRWEEENPQIFEDFPLTAFYANPGAPGDDFDIQAYMRQFRQSTVAGEAIREGVTPEQYEAERNRLLGGIAYRNAARKVQGRTDEVARAWLRSVHAQLQEQYPGYDTETIGLSQRPDRDVVIAEMERWSPELLATDAGQGVEKYLQARQTVINRYVASGGVATGWKTANGAAQSREWLRSVATQVMRDHPAFTTVWQRVFESELRADVAQEPVNLTLPSAP